MGIFDWFKRKRGISSKSDWQVKLDAVIKDEQAANRILRFKPKYAYIDKQIEFLDLVTRFLQDASVNIVVKLYMYEHAMNKQDTRRLLSYLAYLEGAAEGN